MSNRIECFEKYFEDYEDENNNEYYQNLCKQIFRKLKMKTSEIILFNRLPLTEEQRYEVIRNYAEKKLSGGL